MLKQMTQKKVRVTLIDDEVDVVCLNWYYLLRWTDIFKNF